MKKSSNIMRFGAVFILGFSLFASLFGCKTVPVENPVNPLDLLDGNSAFFIAIPTQAEPALIERVIKNNVGGVTDKEISQVVARVSKLYCGLNHTKNTTTLQGAVACNIPRAYVPKIFSKKKGFTSREYVSGESDKYAIYSNGAVDISCPDPSVICLGRDVPTMLDTYTLYSKAGSPEQSVYFDQNLYNWLLGAEDEIRFFANKPQSFLTILTGANLDLKLSYVQGAMKSDPKLDKQYLLDLEFEFKSEKYAKAGKTMLSFAFGLTDSSTELLSPTHLKISGVKIAKEQLYKLLIL